MSRTYNIAVKREIDPLVLDLNSVLEKGRAVRVVVTSNATKTKEQLGYWWAVIIPRVQEGLKLMGNEMSQAEVNQFLNDKFFCKTKTVVIKKGLDEWVYTIRTPRSKSGATVDEMSELIDKVIRWASIELGVYIPSPYEVAHD